MKVFFESVISFPDFTVCRNLKTVQKYTKFIVELLLTSIWCDAVPYALEGLRKLHPPKNSTLVTTSSGESALEQCPPDLPSPVFPSSTPFLVRNKTWKQGFL